MHLYENIDKCTWGIGKNEAEGQKKWPPTLEKWSTQFAFRMRDKSRRMVYCI